jgi:hypothetical protein
VRSIAWVLLSGVTIFLSGCAGVYVVDPAGQPIPNAKVYAVSLSMNIGPNITDSKGYAQVPSNIQGAQWIAVECNGYKDASIPVPGTYPATIVLTKQ